MVTCTAWILQI